MKKSIRSTLAVFLLLCFSAAVLPLDFFHNHSDEHTVCSEAVKHNTCHHKLHISKKSAYCFACKFHLDKTFISSPFIGACFKQSYTELVVENKIAASTLLYLFTFLRGPPSK